MDSLKHHIRHTDQGAGHPVVGMACLMVMAGSLSLAGCRETNVRDVDGNVLKAEIEKYAVTDFDVPRRISARVEHGGILIEPHLVVVFGGSDVQVTARRVDNSIIVLEQEVLKGTTSSLGQGYKIAVRVDTSSFPTGQYTLIVERRLWDGAKGQWRTETAFRDAVAISN